MALDVWIPGDAPPEAHEALADSPVSLHEYPPAGGWPEPKPHADLLVIVEPEPALDAIAHLEGIPAIQALWAGVDAIADRIPDGITLCDASGVHDVGVGEWVIGAIIASFRDFPTYALAQAEQRWPDATERAGMRGRELNGSRVLIVGFGSIGRAVAARLRPFGAEMIGVARHPRDGVHSFDELPSLVPAADVVVDLLPLTPATRGLLGAGVFDRMKPGSLFVNAGRGGTMDVDALTAALRTGRIRAALDVTDPEPLPPGHPLWSAPGLFVTPHIGGQVSGEQGRAWAFVAEQIARLERGEPLRNVVADGY
ncbi:MAG TPA: NAD(P)-dependent oxidoreductase [Candidatus Limnocylindrales bacterium]